MLMVDYGQTGRTPPPGYRDGVGEEIVRRHDAIIGMERRLARAAGEDDSVARSVLTRHYAAFAADMVRRMGGDVRLLKALTDRNTIIPLAGGLRS